MSKFDTLYAHPFSKDGVTHVVVNAVSKVSRRGTHHTLCALKLDTTFKRRAPSMHRIGMTPITCDSCLSSMTGLHEALQKPPYKEGANDPERFKEN